MVVSDDGARAFVSHAVGSQIDVVPLVAAEKARTIKVDGKEDTQIGAALSETPRRACQGFALAKVDGRVLAPHVLVFPGEANLVSSGYGSSEASPPELFDVAVIDEDAAKPVDDSLRLHSSFRDAVHCALPRAAAVGKPGLMVTCLGADSVIALDERAVNAHETALRTWRVPEGPTGIALDDAHDRALVWSQHAHALTILATGGVAAGIALASVTVPRAIAVAPEIARGRALFHATEDRRISADGRACASCHPDGRDDGLVWSSPNGPRQTPMLAGRLDGAAPYGWNGDGKTIAAHLKSTMNRLRGTGLPDEERDALIAYVRTMRPPAAPDADHDALVTRGSENLHQSPRRVQLVPRRRRAIAGRRAPRRAQRNQRRSAPRLRHALPALPRRERPLLSRRAIPHAPRAAYPHRRHHGPHQAPVARRRRRPRGVPEDPMNAARALALAAALAATAMTADLHADTAPLSSIPITRIPETLPALRGGGQLSGVAVQTRYNTPYLVAAASSDACLVSYSDAGRPVSSNRDVITSSATSVRVERLVTAEDGSATLEVNAIQVDEKSYRLRGRLQVPLTVVARDPRGIVVYAYRAAGELVILTSIANSGGSYRNAPAPPKSGEPMPFSELIGFADCSLNRARLDPRYAGAAVLTGRTKAEGEAKSKLFTINASLSKVTRDPEPILSVSVRVDEPRSKI